MASRIFVSSSVRIPNPPGRLLCYCPTPLNASETMARLVAAESDR